MTAIEALSWCFVIGQGLRSLVCVGAAMRGGRVRYGHNGAPDLQAIVQRDVLRWRIAAAIDAPYHALIGAFMFLTLVVGEAPRTRYAFRLSLFVLSAAALVALSRAIWCSLVKHRHIYRALERGMGAAAGEPSNGAHP